MFSKAMVQRSTRLANVGAGAFGTWDVVRHSLSVVCWYWVLGVHMLLPQGPEGMEGNLDGPLIGGPRPYGWIQTVYLCRGESQIHGSRSQVESPIRLRAGVHPPFFLFHFGLSRV